MMKFTASAALATTTVAALKMEARDDPSAAISAHSSETGNEGMKDKLFTKQAERSDGARLPDWRSKFPSMSLPSRQDVAKFLNPAGISISLPKRPEIFSGGERMVFGAKQFPIDEISTNWLEKAKARDVFITKGGQVTEKPKAGADVYVKVEIKEKQVEVKHKVEKKQKTSAEMAARSEPEQFLNLVGIGLSAEKQPEVQTEIVTKTPAEVYAEFRKKNTSLRAKNENQKTVVLGKETDENAGDKFYKYVPARIVYVSRRKDVLLGPDPATAQQENIIIDNDDQY